MFSDARQLYQRMAIMKSRHNHSQHTEAGSQGLVQQRAYELYVARGQAPGHELEDWLQAEVEIKSGQQQRQSSPAPK